MNKKVFVTVIGVVGATIGSLLLYDTLSQDEFRYAGTLEATRVVVPARLSSAILTFDVMEGDSLKEGQVIALLDDEDLKISLKNIHSKYKRGLYLNGKGEFPQAELETLEAEKDALELKLQWCTIRAPFSGKVLSKYKEAGEWVSPGVGILSMADIQRIWAFFYVEQAQVVQLSLGQDVYGTLPELPGRIFRGKIIKINDEPEFTPKNVQTREERTRLVYGIKVQFENTDEVLKPGMTIETDFGGVTLSKKAPNFLKILALKKKTRAVAN